MIVAFLLINMHFLLPNIPPGLEREGCTASLAVSTEVPFIRGFRYRVSASTIEAQFNPAKRFIDTRIVQGAIGNRDYGVAVLELDNGPAIYFGAEPYTRKQTLSIGLSKVHRGNHRLLVALLDGAGADLNHLLVCFASPGESKWIRYGP